MEATTLIYVFDSSSHNCKYKIISEADCPIVIKDRTVTFNPKKMNVVYQYFFTYLGDKLMAVKNQDGTIDIYEVLDEK